MSRLIAIFLSTLSLIGGGTFAWAHLAGLPAEHVLCRLGVCGTLTYSTDNEPLNPFAWSDLAEARAASGDNKGAQDAFARSLQLGPNIPPILLRVINFAVQNGNLDTVISPIRHVLELTNVYDNILFRYLVRSGLPPERILAEAIPDSSDSTMSTTHAADANEGIAPVGDRRPAGDPGRAWAAFLMAERRPEAGAAYRWLEAKGAVTPALRNQWVEYLVQVQRDYPQAVQTWAAAYREAGYPETNRVFNSRFARTPAGGRMDWVLPRHPHVQLKTGDGLLVTFDGKENTAFGSISQQTYLPAGRWRFTAEAVADGLTTNQRPYFRIYDSSDPRRLDASTPMAPERMTVEFVSPAGGSWVTIVLIRRQSEKFDNKIAGSLRLREVRIGRANGTT